MPYICRQWLYVCAPRINKIKTQYYVCKALLRNNITTLVLNTYVWIYILCNLLINYLHYKALALWMLVSLDKVTEIMKLNF